MVEIVPLGQVRAAVEYAGNRLFKLTGFPGELQIGYLENWWRSMLGTMNASLWAERSPEGEIFGVLGALYYPSMVNPSLVTNEVLFFVAPEHCGRGIGPRLLDVWEAEARRRGVRTMLGSCMADEPSGETLGKLYCRNGFRLLEHVYVKDLWAGQQRQEQSDRQPDLSAAR